MGIQVRDGKRNEPLFGHSRGTGHAVVVGASMGGLFAARVLSDHFDRVTVVDRDGFPGEPGHRKGVPQSHHAHAMLARGQGILERLFPGIMGELRGAGALAGGSLSVVTLAGKLASTELEGDGAFASRVLLEWAVRRRVAALGGVGFVRATEVTGLTTTADGGRVTGVRLRPRGGEGDTKDAVRGAPGVLGADLEADLVVDASGRRSRAPRWLEDLGYDAPPEETVNSGLGYASRFYEKPEGFPGEWDGIIINARPPGNPRAGLILPIESGKWHVTLAGYAENYPPTDERGFMRWARDLPDPSLYESIRVARPITPIRAYRTPTNRLRHFEKMVSRPEGFIATGDSVCAFNPIYGQGMTTSALDALVLDESLRRQKRRPRPGFEDRFQRDVSRTVAAPWLVATGEDLRWEGVKVDGAASGVGTGFIHRYTNVLLRRAVTDAVASEAYHDVIQMLARPRSLFKPGVALRVLREALTPTVERDGASEPALSPEALAGLRARPGARLEVQDAGR